MYTYVVISLRARLVPGAGAGALGLARDIAQDAIDCEELDQLFILR